MNEVTPLWKGYRIWFLYGFWISLSISSVSWILGDLLPSHATSIQQRASNILVEPMMLYTPILILYSIIWAFAIRKVLTRADDQFLDLRVFREIAGAATYYLVGVAAFVILVEAITRNFQISFLAVSLVIFFSSGLVASHFIRKIPLEQSNQKGYRLAALIMLPVWLILISLMLYF